MAPVYGVLERLAFGDAMQACRTAFLDRERPCGPVLVLGEGTGRFVEALARRHPGIEVDVVESSAGMRSRIRRRLRALDPAAVEGIRLHDVSALEFDPDASTAPFGLIVTNFFLDCFRDATLEGWGRSRVCHWVGPGTEWWVADFREVPAGWRRVRSQAWIRFLYACFRLVARIEAGRLPDIGAFLSNMGFSLEERRLLQAGMLSAERWRR